jgi:hypothetical protein
MHGGATNNCIANMLVDDHGLDIGVRFKSKDIIEKVWAVHRTMQTTKVAHKTGGDVP